MDNIKKISEVIEESDNRYVLVHAVAKRAKKIMESTINSNVEISSSKAIDTAIQEILHKKGRY
jgi:DNA-directed RNA polymerase subunit K/omega